MFLLKINHLIFHSFFAYDVATDNKLRNRRSNVSVRCPGAHPYNFGVVSNDALYGVAFWPRDTLARGFIEKGFVAFRFKDENLQNYNPQSHYSELVSHWAPDELEQQTEKLTTWLNNPNIRKYHTNDLKLAIFPRQQIDSFFLDEACKEQERSGERTHRVRKLLERRVSF